MGEGAAATGVDTEEPSRQSGTPPRVIAVDGSAASGKSSIGRMLATRLRYPFLDTGIMYRAITLSSIERGIDLHDSEALAQLASSVRIDVSLPEPESGESATIMVDSEDVTSRLRRPDVEEAVSIVSRVPGVREALVRLQRELAGKQAVVMAGRDIGTVVLPDADLKVYLDASPEERARRRHQEFERLGRNVGREMVLEDIRRRDRIDSEREVSPLRPADDAVVIQTDGLSLDQVLEKVVRLVERQS